MGATPSPPTFLPPPSPPQDKIEIERARITRALLRSDQIDELISNSRGKVQEARHKLQAEVEGGGRGGVRLPEYLGQMQSRFGAGQNMMQQAISYKI